MWVLALLLMGHGNGILDQSQLTMQQPAMDTHWEMRRWALHFMKLHLGSNTIEHGTCQYQYIIPDHLSHWGLHKNPTRASCATRQLEPDSEERFGWLGSARDEVRGSPKRRDINVVVLVDDNSLPPIDQEGRGANYVYRDGNQHWMSRVANKGRGWFLSVWQQRRRIIKGKHEN